MTTGAYYQLEDTLKVILVKAAHAKGLPGRKIAVSDSVWLSWLGWPRSSTGFRPRQ